jgi:hypothetical protein
MNLNASDVSFYMNYTPPIPFSFFFLDGQPSESEAHGSVALLFWKSQNRPAMSFFELLAMEKTVAMESMQCS